MKDTWWIVVVAGLLIAGVVAYVAFSAPKPAPAASNPDGDLAKGVAAVAPVAVAIIAAL
jgi:hypothetical protein